MTNTITFAALADKHRHEIIQRLAQKPLSVGSLASHFSISRPAVSQHLKILSDAGLVHVRQDGTRRIYAVNHQGIADIRTHLDRLWKDAFAAYADAALTLSEQDTT
ncbi:MAG: metalloregulator ArsR/SmtB family transcription factor [Paracoccaceae bacterium]